MSEFQQTQQISIKEVFAMLGQKEVELTLLKADYANLEKAYQELLEKQKKVEK